MSVPQLELEPGVLVIKIKINCLDGWNLYYDVTFKHFRN